MRALLIASTVALALASCGTKTADTTANTDTTAMSENTTMPGDNAMAGNAMVGNSAGMTAMSTDEFLKKAAMSDMFEVKEGKLAETSATAAGLKDFGKKMVAEHTATTTALKAAVAKDGVKMTPPAALDERHMALYDTLKAAKGADFDAMYKSQQADSHAEALATMQGYAKGGDKSAIKAFASDTAPKVQSHIDMLGKL